MARDNPVTFRGIFHPRKHHVCEMVDTRQPARNLGDPLFLLTARNQSLNRNNKVAFSDSVLSDWLDLRGLGNNGAQPPNRAAEARVSTRRIAVPIELSDWNKSYQNLSYDSMKTSYVMSVLCRKSKDIPHSGFKVV